MKKSEIDLGVFANVMGSIVIRCPTPFIWEYSRTNCDFARAFRGAFR